MTRRFCPQCAEYWTARVHVVSPAIVEHCRSTGEKKGVVVERFRTGIHARHLAGLSLTIPAGVGA